MPADVFGTFNNPYFHFHGITRTEGRYVLLHLLLFKLLNNVAHNLISYLGKLISRGLRHPIMFMLLLCVFRFELRQQPCLLFSQSQVFQKFRSSKRYGPATVSNASDVSRHGCPTVTLAELPSLLTPQAAYSAGNPAILQQRSLPLPRPHVPVLPE